MTPSKPVFPLQLVATSLSSRSLWRVFSFAAAPGVGCLRRSSLVPAVSSAPYSARRAVGIVCARRPLAFGIPHPPAFAPRTMAASPSSGEAGDCAPTTPVSRLGDRVAGDGAFLPAARRARPEYVPDAGLLSSTRPPSLCPHPMTHAGARKVYQLRPTRSTDRTGCKRAGTLERRRGRDGA